MPSVLYTIKRTKKTRFAMNLSDVFRFTGLVIDVPILLGEV